MRVEVEDQNEDARVVRGDDGDVCLVLRAGLLTTRAYVALSLALAPLSCLTGPPLVEQGNQYLYDAG